MSPPAHPISDDGGKDDDRLSDEEMRKLLKPNPTTDEVLSAVRKSYERPCNAAGSAHSITFIKQLDSYDDRNYLISIDGTRHLAKVYNGVESINYVRAVLAGNTGSKIHLNNAVYKHVSAPKYRITANCPFPVKNPSRLRIVMEGESSVGEGVETEIEVNAGDDLSVHLLPVLCPSRTPRPLAVQVLTWVDGPTMSSIRSLPIETVAAAGAYLGRLCRALDDMPKPLPEAATAYHAWDGRHTADLKKFVDCITDGRIRSLTKGAIAAFEEEILSTQKKENGEDCAEDKFRMGLLHGDFNDANIILEKNYSGRVGGVIDFGDCVYSWRVLEVSIAMTYAMINPYGRTKHSLASAAAILRGFHAEYPLTEIERRFLRLLVACRLSCSITWGAYSLKQNPDNAEYLLLHAKPAWEALELIWGGGCDPSAVDRLFDMACDGSVGANGSPKKGGDIIDCSDIAIPDPCVFDVFRSSRVTEPPPTICPFDAGGSNKRKRDENGNKGDAGPVITFVTGNRKKLDEVRQILSEGGVEIPFEVTNCKLDLPELQGETEHIASQKCTLAAEQVGGAVITEDTSLCFNGLCGMPGPYIKWFLEKCGHDGLNRMLAGTPDKSAYAQTVVAFCPKPGGEVVVFDGRTDGKIVPARGPPDFGWDPVFEPDEGNGLTYAEMTKDAKNAISHRGRSFSHLRQYLVDNVDTVRNNMGV